MREIAESKVSLVDKGKLVTARKNYMSEISEEKINIKPI